MISDCCGKEIVTGLPGPGEQEEPRCSGCGHRQAYRGVRPRETRSYPAKRWSREILGRWKATHGKGRKG